MKYKYCHIHLFVAVYSSVRKYLEFSCLRGKRDKKKQMMQNFPCWLRHFWETDNLFSCEERIKRKKNAERALLSIHLFVSLSSLSLNLSLHFPLVLPYSFWPFIIFPCPTAFSSLPFSFVFPSHSLLLFIPISCLPVLSNRPLGFFVCQ